MNKRPHRNYALDRIVGLLGLTAIALALAMFVSPAFASEPRIGEDANEETEEQVDAVLLTAPQLANTGALDVLRDEARRHRAARLREQEPEMDNDSGMLDIDIEVAERNEFVEDAIETRCVPLVQLSNDDTTKKIFIGIGFDGVVGIHGAL